MLESLVRVRIKVRVRDMTMTNERTKSWLDSGLSQFQGQYEGLVQPEE